MLQYLCGHDPRMGRESPHLFFFVFDRRLRGEFFGKSTCYFENAFFKDYISNDDNSQGWGYSISKIEHVPYGVLQVLFPPYKKGD